MILFRSIEFYYGMTDDSLVDGVRAKTTPGRWHSMDVRAVYCSTTLTATYAESGFWRLLQTLSMYLANPTSGMVDELRRKNGLTIRTANVAHNVAPGRIAEISSPAEFAKWVGRLRSSLTFDDAIHPGAGRNYRRTQSLANKILGEGYCGLQVPSARALGMVNVVFFPDLFNSSESLSVQSIADRTLFYSNAGARWNGTNPHRIVDSEIIVGGIGGNPDAIVRVRVS